ncbi:MAG: helix-turn-helix transcriptional regulator [Lachnospiraceae bacterium]|nr:helix-turn-helix transcriptional regulator [Lachnospiraceae bacterium]
MSTKERAPAASAAREEADVLYDTEPVLAYIRSRIAELCEKKHISKYRLNKRCGVSPKNVMRYIEGCRVPTIETIAKLCAGFGITLSEFFEDMPAPERPSFNDPRDSLLEIWDKLDQNGQSSLLSFGKYLADSEEKQS